MKISEINEALNLYKLHKNPEQLDNHDQIKNQVWAQDPESFVDKNILRKHLKRIEYINVPKIVVDNETEVDLYDDGGLDEIASDITHDIFREQLQEFPLWELPPDAEEVWEEAITRLILEYIGSLN